MESGERPESPLAKRPKLEDSTATIEAILPDSLIKPMIYERCFIASLDDKRRLSEFIQEINKAFPLPAFQHLKRVRNGDVFLFPVSMLGTDPHDVPAEDPDQDRYTEQVKQCLAEKRFPDNLLAICSNVRLQDLPAIGPQLKAQYKEAAQLWPCKFHEDKELERLTKNELFNTKEVLAHCRLMQICYSLKSFLSSNCVAMVVDPCQNAIVSLGWAPPIGDNNDDDDLMSLIPGNHSVMRAVDNVALSQGGGAWSSPEDEDLLRRGLIHANELYAASKECQFATRTEPTKYGPYLCTGFDVYVIEEPCLMCSMALVHSRAGRIFFRENNVANGALGGGNQLKLHSVKELNHHYQVFRVNKEISESW